MTAPAPDVDEKDLRVLSAVADLKTGSPERISEATGIPSSTVHYRLQSLRARGVLKNDALEVDLEAVGLSLTLITEVHAEYGEGYHERVGERLAALEGVNKVYFTLGGTDFVLVSHLPSQEMVEDLVSRFERLDAVTRTSSTLVVTQVKDESNPLADYEFGTLADALLSD